ncbi:MAG: PEP-CTERM sorting domain-containing protein [Phycisphaerae bacterium]|nr:PEP-CTERM sorting domain-containing protein [Phycisphaerae bacterium]
MWQASGGSFSHIQMNDMDIYGDSTIGPTDWFYVSTTYGNTRMKGQVENLNIKDNNVPGDATVTTGDFNIPAYQSQMYGSLKVWAEYHFLGIAWVSVPGYYPYTENLADHNAPPPTSDMSGSVSGSHSSPTITTSQQTQQTIDLADMSDGLVTSGSMVVDFDSTITANTVGTPTLLLHADAGSDTGVYGTYANATLSASGSYDPQADTITSYAWDLDGDGNYDDESGVSASVTAAEMAALGLGYGDHIVGLKILADDGYWATDEVMLTYLPSLLGDADSDGDIDADDLATWGANYTGTGGTGKLWMNGDFDGDGDVDSDDLATWGANYTGPGGAAMMADMMASVPEPATMSLLVLGGIALIRRRK